MFELPSINKLQSRGVNDRQLDIYEHRWIYFSKKSPIMQKTNLFSTLNKNWVLAATVISADLGLWSLLNMW